MENLTKINCAETTYVCNFRPNVNFCKDEKLFVGSVHDNHKNLNLYKSLFQFYISDLNLDSSKSVYLFLFLENIYPTSSNSISVSISGNDTTLDICDINWSSLPKKNNRVRININIPTNSIKKYIKIDISRVIKSLNSYNNTYTIIMEPLNFYTASVLQFSSKVCSNPPYLVLVNDNYENNIGNKVPFDDYEYEYDDIENNNIEEFSKEIKTKLNSQNSKLNSFEERLSNTPPATNSNSDDIDNKVIPSLNKFDNLPEDLLNRLTSDLNELTRSEISQLKNSVNYDIVELKNSVNNVISNLDSSIKEITQTLSLLSNEVSKISEIIGNIIIEPLEDKTNNL
ncbi:DNRLRE domain-containing protein [Clostridium sp.]|uniref:DNRLRE domain-containing protein n=1 Tax=Clostridium sp. TaxID=1506 RepID=UPI002604DEFF|nr:DNRLRE domain-containing protein [Clostridium sp.]